MRYNGFVLSDITHSPGFNLLVLAGCVCCFCWVFFYFDDTTAWTRPVQIRQKKPNTVVVGSFKRWFSYRFPSSRKKNTVRVWRIKRKLYCLIQEKSGGFFVNKIFSFLGVGGGGGLLWREWLKLLSSGYFIISLKSVCYTSDS